MDDTIPGSGKVFDILKSKHPAAAPLNSAALLPDSAPTIPVHSVIIDMLDGSVIRATALREQSSSEAEQKGEQSLLQP